jgi:hypothetical protein
VEEPDDQLWLFEFSGIMKERPPARVPAREIAVGVEQEVNRIFVVLADRSQDWRIGKMKQTPKGSETQKELSETHKQTTFRSPPSSLYFFSPALSPFTMNFVKSIWIPKRICGRSFFPRHFPTISQDQHSDQLFRALI